MCDPPVATNTQFGKKLLATLQLRPIPQIKNVTSLGGHQVLDTLKACLHGGGGSQIGEVTCGWSPHLRSM